MTILWPAVYAAVLELLPSLPGWEDVTVSDGVPTSDAATSLLAIVGWVDDEEAGTWQRGRAPSGMEMLEEGNVRSVVMSSTGALALAQMRSKAFTLIEEFAAFVERDRTLGGLLPPQSEVSVAATVQSMVDEDGTAQYVTFALHYTAIQ